MAEEPVPVPEEEIPEEPIPKAIGSVIFDVETRVDHGTPPLELILTLFDNEVPVAEERFILSDAHIGRTIPLESVFTVKEAGRHTVYTQIEAKNPWGTETMKTDPDTFEILKNVIPIMLGETWELWFDGRARTDEAIVAVSDFRARGWNFGTGDGKTKVDTGSEARDEWAAFVNDTRHAVCIFSYGQCEFDSAGRPMIWGTLMNGTKAPGTIDGGDYIHGNGGSRYHIEGHALVKYLRYKNRSVIICVDNDDHLFMSSDWHRKIWLWIATKGSSVTRPWFIFDKEGTIVDWGPEVV